MWTEFIEPVDKDVDLYDIDKYCEVIFKWALSLPLVIANMIGTGIFTWQAPFVYRIHPVSVCHAHGGRDDAVTSKEASSWATVQDIWLSSHADPVYLR